MDFFLFSLVALLARDGVVARGGHDCRAKTKLATFNTGLVPFFRSVVDGDPEIEERAAILIEEIEQSGVDIFCLQEVFFADIQRQIYSDLKDTYPYILTATDLTVDDTNSETACTQEESQGCISCLVTECADLVGPSFLICSVSCLAQIAVQPCRDCIALYGPETGPLQCSTEFLASRFEINYGLMLLSRNELRNTRISGFNNQSQFRGYLEASVKGVGDLVCTHLSSFFPIYIGPPVASPLLYPNYDLQQYDELLTLFDLVTTKETPILIGDFNSGPASPGNTWEFPFHYGLISARGFVSPYVLEDGRCTFCTTDNPSVALTDFPDLLLDHIYLTTDSYKGRVISSKRFLDNILLESGNPLSDHYGVKVTLKNTHSRCRGLDRKKFYCPRTSEPQLLPLPAPQAELDRLCVAST